MYADGVGTEPDGRLTEEEVGAALRTMPTDTSPGLDGLPYEFYTAFWPDIAGPLVAAINEAFLSASETPRLDGEFTMGLITLSSAWVTGVRKRGGKEQAPRAEGEAAEGETQDESPVPTACEATLCAGPPKGPGGTHEERSHAPAAAPTTPCAPATPAFLGPRPVACVRQPRPPDLASGGQAGRRALVAVEWDRAGSQKHTPQAQASAAPQPGRRRGRHAEHPKQGR